MKNLIKATAFILALLISQNVSSQEQNLSNLYSLLNDIQAQFENGEFLSSAKLSALNAELKTYSFENIPNNFIQRMDTNESESVNYFLFLPDFFDSLFVNNASRLYAKEIYEKFRRQGAKGHDRRTIFKQSVQTLKSHETAVIRIMTMGKQGIAIIAQPFARISVDFYSDNKGKVSGMDSNKHKGYPAKMHFFEENGKYFIEIHVRNVSDNDISFTIIAD